MNKGLMLAIGKFTADEFGIHVTKISGDENFNYIILENDNNESVSVTEVDNGYLVTEFDTVGNYLYKKATEGNKTGGAGSYEGNSCEKILTQDNYRHEIKAWYNETLALIEEI